MPTTFAGTIFDPRFCVGFVPLLEHFFVTFLAFFALAGDLGASSVFDRRPKRNPSFLYTNRLRNPPKGCSEENLKTDPEKYIKNGSFGGQFWLPFLSLRQLLALSWGTLLLSFWLLVPRAFEREVQERPGAAQELPESFRSAYKISKTVLEGAKGIPEIIKIDPRVHLAAEIRSKIDLRGSPRDSFLLRSGLFCELSCDLGCSVLLSLRLFCP